MSATPLDGTTKQRGEADVMFGFLILAVAVTAVVYVATDAMNRSSCEDFGKVRIFGKLYECRPVDQKK